MKIIIPASKAKSIVDFNFDLDVQIERKACKGRLPNKVSAAEKNGITLKFSDVLTNGAIHTAMKIKVQDNEDAEKARIRTLWERIEPWDPKIKTNKSSKRRLIIDKPENGEQSREISQILGECIGITAISDLTEIEPQNWTSKYYKKGVYHDFESNSSKGKVLAEVRGRYNGNNEKLTIRKTSEKFVKLLKNKQIEKHSYNKGIGLIYNLRSDSNDDDVKFKSDVILVDPGRNVKGESEETYRSILHYYSAFFEVQNKHKVSKFLLSLADNDNPFLNKQKLPLPSFHRAGGDIWGRTTILINNHYFIGTVWEKIPGFIFSKIFNWNQPVLFWGIPLELCSNLSTNNYRALLSMKISPWAGMKDGYYYSMNKAGLMIVIAKNIKHFLNHP